MKPSELIEFNINMKPESTISESIKLELYLYNLPEKSLGNVVAKKINGREAIQCLSIEVKTKPVHSQLEVYPLYRKIVQPLYENYGVNEWVKICNNSSVRRFYSISRICQDEGVDTICSEPEGIVEPNC